MKRSILDFFSAEDIKRILTPGRSITAIIGELSSLAEKVVREIEKKVYQSKDDFILALSQGKSELNEWFGEVDVFDGIICVERCVTDALKRALIDKKTGKFPPFYDEIESKYLSLKGAYTVVLNPLCIICHVVIENIARSVAIPGNKVRIFPLAYRSGLTGKRVYADKVIKLVESKSKIAREKIESLLDKYECLYYLDFIG